MRSPETTGPDGPDRGGLSHTGPIVRRVSERTVPSFDGTTIWFSDSDGDGPLVVLLHGVSMTSISNFATHFGVDADGKRAQIPGPTIASTLREAGARVVDIDARGHGRSGLSADPDAYRGDAHVSDVTAVLDALQVDRVDLVGYSMGSFTAARLLDREPRLRSVALCGSGPWFVDGRAEEMLASMHARGACFQSNLWAEHPEHKAFRAYARLDPIHDFASIGAAMIGCEAVSPERLARASVPVLVLNGADDDGDDAAAKLARLVPGAVAVIGGTGDHGMAPSDPEFHAPLVAFLRQGWPA